MDDTVIVIMLKNKCDGFLEKEIATCTVFDNESYLINIYAEYSNDDELEIHMKVSCENELSDSDFNAVYDYYDESIYDNIADSVIEVDDCFNPTWEIVFKSPADDNALQAKINSILEIHKNEMIDVFDMLKNG